MGGQTPIALTIAGSDSGGGAGIQADLKAFSARGVFGASAITAITAQNTQAVTAVHPIPAEVVSAQIAAVLEDIKPQAIKIGMLFSPEIIAAVANALDPFEGPIVLDPVMIAKSGDALLQDAAIDALKIHLFSRADVLTPNLPEAARLLDQDEADSTQVMETQGRTLLAEGPKAVLMKGGHSTGKTCTDLLVTEDDAEMLTACRIEPRNTHGTGCTYSSTIAAELAKGATLSTAIATAHDYLHRAIAKADSLDIGSGHGPIHHFHAQWIKH